MPVVEIDIDLCRTARLQQIIDAKSLVYIYGKKAPRSAQVELKMPILLTGEAMDFYFFHGEGEYRN